jgi:phosphatidylinositol-3-phosphatase
MKNRTSLFCLAAIGIAVAAAAQTKLPHPDHIVIVVEENKGYTDVIGSAKAPFINSLAKAGANLTNYHGLHHPSQPNYLELFSASNQGVCNDTCPPSPALFSAPNLAGSLMTANRTFAGFADALPAHNLAACTSGDYARKHCPWLDFSGIPASVSFDTTAFPQTPAGFAKLPDVSIVVPDLVDDMHSDANGGHSIPAEVAQGDKWLKAHIGEYAKWAMKNNSLLIVTWDEDSASYTYPNDCSQAINTPSQQFPNRIATIIVGGPVKRDNYKTEYTHYNLLRTIEDIYGLARIGGSSGVQPITEIWK